MPLYLFYTMVQKSQKWPKTQIKGGPALILVNSKNLRTIRKSLTKISRITVYIYIVMFLRCVVCMCDTVLAEIFVRVKISYTNFCTL